MSVWKGFEVRVSVMGNFDGAKFEQAWLRVVLIARREAQ